MGVVQIFRRAHLSLSKIILVTIVGGNSIREGKLGGFNCCKRELVARTQSALQGKRLLIAPELKHAKTLLQELSTFRVKVNNIPRISRKSAAGRKRMSTFRIGPLVTSHEVQCVGQ